MLCILKFGINSVVVLPCVRPRGGSFSCPVEDVIARIENNTPETNKSRHMRGDVWMNYVCALSLKFMEFINDDVVIYLII